MGPTSAHALESTAIAIYDYLLTIPSEIKCVWQRKATVASGLLVLVRYITLLQVGMLSANFVSWEDPIDEKSADLVSAARCVSGDRIY